MKPFGIRADQRNFEQQYYGGYCNRVRENNLEPLSYVRFQELLRNIVELNLSKKETMKKLIESTK